MGHVKTDDSEDLSLYDISFDRDAFGSLKLEDMEINTALSQFNPTDKISKNALAKLFGSKEKKS